MGDGRAGCGALALSFAVSELEGCCTGQLKDPSLLAEREIGSRWVVCSSSPLHIASMLTCVVMCERHFAQTWISELSASCSLCSE